MKFMIVVIFIVVGFPALLFAQDNDTSINVGQLIAPWLETLLGAVAVLITAILGWVAALIQRKTGIDIEARHREALQQALTNAVGKILQKASSSLDTKTIDVRSPLIKDAIEYVANAVPDAIDKFGLGADDIAEKIVAKLGVVTAPTTEPK